MTKPLTTKKVTHKSLQAERENEILNCLKVNQNIMNKFNEINAFYDEKIEELKNSNKKPVLCENCKNC